jgi:hypothetical protein
MAFDAYNEGVAAIQQLVNRILDGGSEGQQAALQYAEDPDGTLAEQGITDADLSGLDMRQLVADCAAGHDLPYSTQQSLQSYTSGGSGPSYPVSHPPATSHSASEVVQHLNYVTYATYEGDEQITQQLISYEDYSTNIDNSVDVDVDGDVDGDLDIDTTNVNATGDGAVAAGDDAEGVATGDGAVAAGDDIENAATGDGSQIIDGDNFGQANTGDGAVLVGDDLEAPVNTGEFTGVQADGDVENTVVGDDNETAQVSGDADNSAFGFGNGATTSFGEAEFDDTAVSVGSDGDTTNVSDNELDEGAALSGTGDAEGSFEEVDVDVEQDIDVQETEIDAEDSVVTATLEEGPGDLEDTEVDQEDATAGA